MKLEKFKIAKQINIYLGAIFIIVLVLLGSSLYYMNSLWKNTEDLYDHPLTVRGAVGEIKGDVLLIQRDMRQLPLEKNQQEIDILISNIDVYEEQMKREIDILYNSYLGPKKNIDDLVNELSRWKSIRTETIRLVQTGEAETVGERVVSDGAGGLQVEKVLGGLQVISDFATNKAEEFYQNALDNRNQIIGQLIFLCIIIIVTLAIIGRYLRNSIVPPLEKLTNATKAINQGELNTRIQNGSTNELGELSRAFNDMAEKIQKEMEYKENAILISSVMFKHVKLRPFSQELLKNLLKFTDSQIGAIYFLNDANRQFDCFESIGAKSNSLVSFKADVKEGEFGKAIALKRVQYLKDIPADVQIAFSTVSGEYKAKEIITIPIISMNEVIAVISLSSIKAYTADSIRLINGLVNEITASTIAVLSSQRIIEFSQKLQSNNEELEQQTKELGIQADELTEQNIELEMQKKQLDQASRLKTNFISNMSHELRTPLNSVIALSGVLSRRLSNKIPDEELSYLEIISRNGKNLLTMINDILDISRIESGHEETSITSFNVNNVIKEIVDMLQAQADQQKIQLIHLKNDEKIVINSDIDKFGHILQNLVSNAVKFTEDGSVKIKVKKYENNLEVVVTDTGIGIPEEHIQHIFDEFRQADGSTSRRYGGTGLGLAISKKYANLLGGTIKVKSTPNVGSEFILDIPIHYEAENNLVEENTNDEYKYEIKKKFQGFNEDLSTKTILLVEDNESAIIQVKDLIENLGCKVLIARDANDAFAVIEQGIPDAMILDLMMPDVDGFKVLEILRNAEATAHVPVLILTAKHITKDELKFLKRNNVHQFIQKGDVKRLELQEAVINLFQVDKSQEELINKHRNVGGKPIILVVEDNPDNMTTVKALLEDKYRVLEAVNAREGIELTNEHLPNLILMDIALPDINGIEAFLKIRNTPQSQHIPVIALTASVMKEDREAILSYGFDAFIGKPIIESEFFVVINEVLYGK